jgi:hypothetical protein
MKRVLFRILVLGLGAFVLLAQTDSFAARGGGGRGGGGGGGRSVSRVAARIEQTLPDLTDDDIAGSGFAITSYTVHRDLGGDAALARLRERLRQRGLKLMLDFVPNHMAPDHPWVGQHPEYFVGGSEIDLARAPRNYFRVPERTARACSLTGAIRISPVGPTRSSSTTATPHYKRR